MTTPRRRSSGPAAALLLCAWFSACAAPPTPTPTPEPAPIQPRPDRQADPAPASDVLATALPNGLRTFVKAAPDGAAVQLQLGVFAGALFEAPGVAELAAITLVRSNNPATGQHDLEQAIERIGGTLDIRVGLMTTWLDIRVPAGKLAPAAKALRAALESITTSRNVIARLRDELVQAKAQAATADPLAATSRATLLGERSTATYLDGLLDVDPSQVGLLHARKYRPEQCLLVVSRAHTPTDTAKMLGAGDSLGAWTAPPAPPGDASLIQSTFETRLRWCAQGAPGEPARVAIVLPLPQQGEPLAAGLLVMHACLTLDGTGGRFERMQDDAGLGHLQWEARYEQTPDSHALVLTTTATPAEAARAWQVLKNARQSLVDVPPSPSEVQLALRRARLNASLPLLDDHARLRAEANLTLAGKPVDVVERRLDVLAATPDFDYASLAMGYARRPFWMAVVGPDMPIGVPDLEPFELLPAGFAPPAQQSAAAAADAASDGWLDRARAASGLPSDFAALIGFEATATRDAALAPSATEEIRWLQDGSLTRARTLLGAVVTTTLAGERWFEELDGQKKSLSEEQAGELRREQGRHPMMILAAVADGSLRFRPIAQREVGDRQLMVMEAVQEGPSRLRLHIDATSNLIRAVEAWDTIGGSVVHIHEEWSDYRRVGTMRVPHRCDTTWNDGEHRARLTFSRWLPITR